jgi:hypothetical protein
LLAAPAALLAGILVIGHSIDQGKTPGAEKRACAQAILDVIERANSRDEAEAMIRTDPNARKVCARFEMNGVPVIP